MKERKRKRAIVHTEESSDSDSSREQTDTNKFQKRKKLAVIEGKQEQQPSATSSSLMKLGQKTQLSEMQNNNVLLSINTHYALVRWWVTEYSKNSHKGMVDPENEEDLLFDRLKDTLYLNMCNTILQREHGENSNNNGNGSTNQYALTIEPRNISNFAYLRHIMSTKDSSPSDTLSSSEESLALREQQRAEIYFSPREWEEAYMRQPYKNRGEQECIRGKKCIGTQIENSKGGFVLVAYHFEHEVVAHREEGKPLQEGRLCIFCLRSETVEFFSDACANQRRFNGGTVVQMHRNSVDEYHPHFMIMGDGNLRQGLTDPIVQQTTTSSQYQLIEGGDVLRYKQLIPQAVHVKYESLEAVAGKLSPFSYPDGARRHNHPLDVVRPHYPDLVQLFEDDALLKNKLLPNSGTHCVHTIQKIVTDIEQRAELARTQQKDYRLYHSLTYMSDAFIPLLLLAEKSQHQVMPQEYLDSSWPNIDRIVMHQGRLPALMHLVFQCCFWSDNSKKSIPIVHILTKGIPKRCQVRSLIDIIDKKQQEDRSLMNFILDIFTCFSLGGYEHSQERPVFEIRKKLYSTLIFDRRAKRSVRNLFMNVRNDTDLKRGKEKQKKVYVNAGLMTLVVREYLCTCVRLIPSLYHVLCKYCDWNTFEDEVFAHADRARSLMNSNHGSGQPWFTGLDAVLHSKKSAKSSSIYQPIKNAFVSTLVNSMNSVEVDALCATDDGNSHPSLTRIGDHGTFLYEQLDLGVAQVLRRALSLYDLDNLPLEITEQLPCTKEEVEEVIRTGKFPLVAFGCSVESATAIRDVQKAYQQEERAKFVHQLVHILWKRPIDFALTNLLFRELELRDSVRLHPLPVHYVQYQYLALLKEHKLPPDTPLEVVAKQYGKVHVCMQCKTMRTPVVTPETNKKSYSYYAYGTERVTVDHVTRKIYCTGKKRNDKPTNTKKLSALLNSGDTFNPLDVERAVKKDKKRKLKKDGEWEQSQRCKDSEITTFYILGQEFEFFGKSYILCCHCGKKTEYNGRRFFEDAFVCGCCTQANLIEEPLHCLMCTKEKPKKVVMTTYKDIISDTNGGGDQGERITIHLCPTHNKPWIVAEYEKHAEQPLTMSRILQGFEEGWKTVTTASGQSVTIASSSAGRKRTRK